VTVLLWVVVGVLSVAVFLLFGAVVELHRGLEQVRRETGVLDSPVVLDLDVPVPLPAGRGLPADLFDRPRALILVLSDLCSTCGTIAEHLHGGLPDGVWLMLSPQSPDTGRDWLARYGLADAADVVVDDRATLSAAIGVDISPSVLRLRAGVVVAAHTLPSARRLDEELVWLTDTAARPVPTP
jgi:hypothetical protein